MFLQSISWNTICDFSTNFFPHLKIISHRAVSEQRLINAVARSYKKAIDIKL